MALSLVHAGALAVEQVKHRALPKSVVDVCRVVYQAKCSLIKVGPRGPGRRAGGSRAVVTSSLSWTRQTHQEQGRSYKEVCAPVIERLRFLFNELRPAVCSGSVLSKLKLLSSLPRWRRVAQKIIRDGRKRKGEGRRKRRGEEEDGGEEKQEEEEG